MILIIIIIFYYYYFAVSLMHGSVIYCSSYGRSVFFSPRSYLQAPPVADDPADAEPAAVPDQEVPRWAGLPQRRKAPLPEPVGETAREHLLLRGRLLL